LPDSLLKLMRTAAQNRNPNVDLGADNTFDLPSWVPQRQPQRPPLSLAGPGLAADIKVSSPSPSADALRTQQPAPTARNLTVQALRMKGVPDADIDFQRRQLCTACAKLNRTSIDWSSELWCFYQTDLSRPKPARSPARRVFALRREGCPAANP
jgi:hypothetical protein